MQTGQETAGHNNSAARQRIECCRIAVGNNNIDWPGALSLSIPQLIEILGETLVMVGPANQLDQLGLYGRPDPCPLVTSQNRRLSREILGQSAATAQPEQHNDQAESGDYVSVS
jgi:hypothetical protein